MQPLCSYTYVFPQVWRILRFISTATGGIAIGSSDKELSNIVIGTEAFVGFP